MYMLSKMEMTNRSSTKTRLQLYYCIRHRVFSRIITHTRELVPKKPRITCVCHNHMRFRYKITVDMAHMSSPNVKIMNVSDARDDCQRNLQHLGTPNTSELGRAFLVDALRDKVLPAEELDHAHDGYHCL
jgi:hypothetical protein